MINMIPIDFLRLVVTVLLSLTWLLSGLVINVLQLLIYVTVKPMSPSLFRRLNYYLTYSSWSQLVSLSESFPGSSSVRLFFADEESRQLFGRTTSIAISNHALEVDWLLLWIAIDKWSFLASAKAMAKSAIKYFPVIGFNWFFNEFVFLARDFNVDSKIISGCIDVFMEYSKPVMVLLFCEGTRRTPEKYAASLAFGATKGIEPFKHHLIPRSRGFALVVQHNAELKKAGKPHMKCIFNVQVAIRKESAPGNFYSLLQGKRILGDIYVEKIDFDDIPVDGVSDWLLHLYRKKDNLAEEHLKTNRFPGKIVEERQRGVLPLVHSIFWSLLVTYFLVYCMFWTNWVGVVFVSTLLTMSLAALVYLVGQSRAKRGSSYGAKSE